MSLHYDCEYNCGATACDAPEAPPRQQVASNDLLCAAISIKPPNLVSRKWRWKVELLGDVMKGKAATEPEAWRLANDAAAHMQRT